MCDAIAGRGGAWSADGRILFGTAASGLFQVPASGGTASPLTTLDASRGEIRHRWPQVLPNGHFMYLAQSVKPENTGVFAASLARPGERVHLLSSSTSAVYAKGGDGKGYLLWLHGGTLVAQELDPATLKLGDPHPVADPVATGTWGQTDAAVSTNGVLL